MSLVAKMMHPHHRWSSVGLLLDAEMAVAAEKWQFQVRSQKHRRMQLRSKSARSMTGRCAKERKDKVRQGENWHLVLGIDHRGSPSQL
mmetsp:Transcript_23524/g.35528  ORF Transcript_23524/g.35528 Transcript_23524/m.35528 type:complete len:88 (-) Transcript_23524:536-799(-)